MFNYWARSLVGRAPALQAGGREFESPRVHQILLKKSASAVFFDMKNLGGPGASKLLCLRGDQKHRWNQETLGLGGIKK